jgi:hypothetical protein
LHFTCHFILPGNCSENVKWISVGHASLWVVHDNTFSGNHWQTAFLCTFHCKAHEKVGPCWRHKLLRLEVQVGPPPHFWNVQCRAVTKCKVVLPSVTPSNVLKINLTIVFHYFISWYD